MNTVHTEELKKKRSSKKSLFTRACNKAETLILVNGSREDIQRTLLQIDDLAGELDEINEELLVTLPDDQQRTAAQDYFAEVGRTQQGLKKRIQEYLMNRDDKSTSTSTASRSSAASALSSISRQARRQAEVAARVKRAAVRQLQEQLILGQEADRLDKKRKKLVRKQKLKGKC